VRVCTSGCVCASGCVCGCSVLDIMKDMIYLVFHYHQEFRQFVMDQKKMHRGFEYREKEMSTLRENVISCWKIIVRKRERKHPKSHLFILHSVVL
jgi:hypothetical protein